MNFASKTIPSLRQASKLLTCMLVTGLLVLSACQPPQASRAPTPWVVRLSTTPAVKSWSQRVGACALKIPGIGLAVDEIPADQPLAPGVTLSLRAGIAASPALPYVVTLGWDEIVILVNASNPINGITLQDLVALYQGQFPTWNELLKSDGQSGTFTAPLEVWAYPQGDDLETFFNQQSGRSADLSNTPQAKVRIAPDPSAMLQAVGQTPGAVGYSLKSYLGENHPSIRSIPITHGDPALLRVPVTAAMPAEPQGLLRQLVLCSQSSQPN